MACSSPPLETLRGWPAGCRGKRGIRPARRLMPLPPRPSDAVVVVTRLRRRRQRAVHAKPGPTSRLALRGSHREGVEARSGHGLTPARFRDCHVCQLNRQGARSGGRPFGPRQGGRCAPPRRARLRPRPARPAGIRAAMPPAPCADGARRVPGLSGSLSGMLARLCVAQHGIEGDQHFAHQGEGGGFWRFCRRR
jgi:hypothetical protein